MKITIFSIIVLCLHAANAQEAQKNLASKSTSTLNSQIDISSATIISETSAKEQKDFTLEISAPVCETEENFNTALIKLRLSIQLYYAKNSRFPKMIDELFPLYIKCKPKIKLKDNFSFNVKHIRSRDFDKDYTKAIDSSGDFIYFADPQSIYFGLLLINSHEKTEENIPLYLY